MMLMKKLEQGFLLISKKRNYRRNRSLGELKENHWEVTGTVFYLKEMQGEFACSLKISGIAKRPNLYSSSKLELPCLMTQTVYDEAKRLGLKTRMTVTLSGHLESWCNRSSSNPKVYFIADKIENVGGF